MEEHLSSSDPGNDRSELRIPATAVSRGVGIGHAVFLNGTQSISYRSDLTPVQIENEIERFHAAVAISKNELTELAAINKTDSPESASGIFGVHLLILEGSSFITNIESAIHEHQINVEWAVREVADSFAERQRAAADEHLRDKYLDVQDVADRLLRTLGAHSGSETNSSGSVLIVPELMPSRLMEIAKSGPTAIISEHGGWTSHTSILARELKLPVVTGVRNIDRLVSDGDQIIVDGLEGQVIIRPTVSTTRSFAHYSGHKASTTQLPPPDYSPAKTLDGCEISIKANADLPHVYQTGLQFGARGIGLYRSEVNLDQFGGFPTEAVQLAAYTQIAQLTGIDGVRIRTFDVSVGSVDGADASLERNPSLGLRSIRLSLTDSAHFRAQIRAIMQAAYKRKVDIVLPMISGVSDVLQLREIIEDEQVKLQNAGISIGEPHVGAMIEVPSAVITASEIARHVDFLCLGTNDLVQYLLAVDRDNETVSAWYQSLHPAVIRAIRQVIAAGNDSGIPVTVCGETAGSPFYVPLLVGLGAREFSMNVNSVDQIRRLICGISAQEASDLVENIDQLETADEIEAVLRAHYLHFWSHLFPAGLLSAKYPQ